jgi:hypothetical protein
VQRSNLLASPDYDASAGKRHETVDLTTLPNGLGAAHTTNQMASVPACQLRQPLRRSAHITEPRAPPRRPPCSRTAQSTRYTRRRHTRILLSRRGLQRSVRKEGHVQPAGMCAHRTLRLGFAVTASDNVVVENKGLLWEGPPAARETIGARRHTGSSGCEAEPYTM